MTKPQLQLEQPWQKTVTDLLDHLGWHWLHVFPLRTKHGWRTPTAGPLGKGWVDLLASRGDWWLLIEVKGETTILEPDQHAVLSLLSGKPYTLTWVLRPTDDISEIARWLAKPAQAPTTYGFNPGEFTRPKARKRT